MTYFSEIHLLATLIDYVISLSVNSQESSLFSSKTDATTVLQRSVDSLGILLQPHRLLRGKAVVPKIYDSYKFSKFLYGHRSTRNEERGLRWPKFAPHGKACQFIY